jgi:phosphoribosylformylglycinamidine synthase PurS subunit
MPERRKRIEVRVELKPEVMDAEAEATKHALDLLGIGGLDRVKMARIYELEFMGLDMKEAQRRTDQCVEKLLANPVIHKVTVRPLGT